jgi:hypothetical protein
MSKKTRALLDTHAVYYEGQMGIKVERHRLIDVIGVCAMESEW